MLALHHNKQFVDEIKSGEHAGVLLDTTCFYAEQGGQIYDEGFITKIGDEVRGEERERVRDGLEVEYIHLCNIFYVPNIISYVCRRLSLQ